MRWLRLHRICSILFAAGIFLWASAAIALEPPAPGEIESLSKNGQLAKQIHKAKALGNHRIDPYRLKLALAKARNEVSLQQGLSLPQVELPTPPPAWKGMPSTGNVKIFVLLVDFSDYPAYNTSAQVNSAIFGNGSLLPNSAPYESLANYYNRASYTLLNLAGGMTLGWYRPSYTRDSMPQTAAAREQLIIDAINSFNSSVDFAQFDNDADGVVDYFGVIWTGPDNGWANFWWGYQTSFYVNPWFTVDGKTLGNYSWQWEYNVGSSYQGPFSPIVLIHETGHALGLPDLYDYNSSIGPDGGVGGLDMMDANWGDHNSFSKWVLNWLTPIVVSSGSPTLTLNPSGTSTHAVLIMPGATSSNAFDEFFMAQNRYRVGNDIDDYPTDGMLIWHVDATLDNSGQDYKYDNSYTDHKLVKLMEADGLERIESYSAWADAAMYYMPGNVFTPTSVPSSYSYLGEDTGVRIESITQAGQQMSASFTIDSAPTLTLGEALDNTALTWTTGGDVNWYSQTVTSYYDGDAAQSGQISDNQNSYLQTTVSGPGNLSFYWKVDSEVNNDFLRFYIDGVEQSGSLSGSTAWAQKSYVVAAGAHTLQWVYTKNGSVNSGADAGWVDRVIWTPQSFEPVATPRSLSVPPSDSDGYYTVSWEASRTQDVTYVLEEAINTSFTSKLRTVYEGSELSAEVTGRKPKTTYYYRVKATKVGYADSDWQIATNGCLVGIGGYVPASITVPAWDADGAYTVSWGASAADNVTYVLEEATDSAFSNASTAYSGILLSADLTGRSQDMTYYYRVKAQQPGYPDSAWKVAGNGCVVSSVLPLTITTSTLSTVTVGTATTRTLVASGGIKPYNWLINAGSLPPEMTLDATTGVISGTPTTVGGYGFTVQVKDSQNTAVSKAFTLKVVMAPLTITTSLFGNVSVGTATNLSLEASGGVEPYTWSLAGGSLPPGLILNGSTGDISGTPTTGGIYSFKVQVKDSQNTVVVKPFTLNVMTAP